VIADLMRRYISEIRLPTTTEYAISGSALARQQRMAGGICTGQYREEGQEWGRWAQFTDSGDAWCAGRHSSAPYNALYRVIRKTMIYKESNNGDRLV